VGREGYLGLTTAKDVNGPLLKKGESSTQRKKSHRGEGAVERSINTPTRPSSAARERKGGKSHKRLEEKVELRSTESSRRVKKGPREQGKGKARRGVEEKKGMFREGTCVGSHFPWSKMKINGGSRGSRNGS